jgi:hypothetical protein
MKATGLGAGSCGVLVLLVVAYVALWAGLFPDKMLRGETQRGAWAGFDVRQPGDWLRLLPLLYATIFAPRGTSTGRARRCANGQSLNLWSRARAGLSRPVARRGASGPPRGGARRGS